MADELTQKFIDALGRLEAERDVETITRLFAEDCEVGNVVAPEKFHGRDGAREFWGAKYRDTFGEVKSSFRNVFDAAGHAALEWTTEGTSTQGAPVKYDGVSLLETRGGLITRFAAYFDSGSLGRQIKEKAHA